VHRLALGVDYLVAHFALAVPPGVRDRLAQHRPTLVERIENTVVLADPRRLHRHPVGAQWVVLAEYCRSARARRPLGFLVGYTHYLRYRWGLRGRREIPVVIARGVLKRLRLRRPGRHAASPG
jgi:hypothetical protein